MVNYFILVWEHCSKWFMQNSVLLMTALWGEVLIIPILQLKDLDTEKLSS